MTLFFIFITHYLLYTLHSSTIERIPSNIRFSLNQQLTVLTVLHLYLSIGSTTTLDIVRFIKRISLSCFVHYGTYVVRSKHCIQFAANYL